ncbi:RnfABCDGE type electron transport complex subunit G [Vibrio sp. MA40-2]|uniref:RnfABCDGE type electron transport complex subunit G n=1 Tax=Vibrio sp. MA40-2 TaxID=3391828 RepID=UPI0039A57C46
MLINIEQWKERVPYQSILLAVACGLAATLLMISQYVTEPIIQLRVEEDQNVLLSQVLAGEKAANKVFDNEIPLSFKEKTFQLFEVKNSQGRLTHYVIRGEQEGYSGVIRYLIGVDLNDEISGVRVLSHTETPGLGDKIEIEKSDWVSDFNGRSLNNTAIWKVKKDGGEFDQFSGATITPRSVVSGVYTAMQALDEFSNKEDE